MGFTGKCENCGKKLYSGHKTNYCQNCLLEKNYKDFITTWKQGLNDGVRGEYQTSRYIHRYLYEKYDGKCAICGWHEINPYTNQVPLELEHIDGDFLNNLEENLSLLCPNCHSLTSTYKGANKGNGRQARKQYK